MCLPVWVRCLCFSALWSICSSRPSSMQVSLALLVCSSALLLLLQGCCTAAKGWKVLKNDATEILPEYNENSRTPEEAMLQASHGRNNSNSNNVNNRAKNGGRGANTVSFSEYLLNFRLLFFFKCVLKKKDKNYRGKAADRQSCAR